MLQVFNGCKCLTDVSALSGWNTGKVKLMTSMFQNCSSLTNVDALNNWDTSNVTGMVSMFQNCSSLTNVELNNWNTSNVKLMSFMFSGCSSLTNVELNNWDMSSVTTMQSMFSGCRSLTSLNISGWKTGNVTEMYLMFYGCSSLINLELNDWETGKVTNMELMFQGCSGLTTLEVNKWDTANVTTFNELFENCNQLETMDLTGWNTEKVENFRLMFSGCNAMKTVNLCSFQFTALKDGNCTNMFGWCSSLETIYAGCDWYDADKMSKYKTSGMFGDCSTSLTGGNGTVWSSNNVGFSNAVLDNTDHEGYLTYKEFNGTYNTTAAAEPVVPSANQFAVLTQLKAKVTKFLTKNMSCTTRRNVLEAAPILTTPSVAVAGSSGSTKAAKKTTAKKKSITTEQKKSAAKKTTTKTTTQNVAGNFKTAKVTKLGSAEIKETLTTKNVTGNEGDLNCWIQHDDGTWTYHFSVYDEQATYYVWEEPLAGYSSNAPEESKVQANYEKAEGETGSGKVTITNTRNRDTADIRIAKMVTGAVETEDYTEFKFKVVLKNFSLDTTVLYGDAVFEMNGADAVAEVTCKNGEAVNITGLPITDEVNYEVTEVLEQNGVYTPTWSGSASAENATVTGTLKKGDLVKLNCGNEKKAVTGSLKIRKILESENVSLTNEDYEQRFAFTVTLTGSGIKGVQTFPARIGDEDATVIFKDGVATVYVSPDKTEEGDNAVLIKNIPEEVKYTVKETTVDGYELTQIQNGAVTEQKRKAAGTIEAGKSVVTVFTNTKLAEKTNDVTLTKMVSGKRFNKDETFTFCITLTGLKPNNEYSYTKDGSEKHITADELGRAQVQEELKHKESIILKNLPVGSTYRISEDACAYYASYKVTDENNLGDIAVTANSNTKTQKDMITGQETVDENEKVTVTFTNKEVTHMVALQKVDEEGNRIEGAELTIWHNPDNGDKVVESDAVQMEQWESDAYQAHTVQLPKGTYILEETKTPAGYIKTTHLIAFRVAEDGTVWVSPQRYVKSGAKYVKSDVGNYIKTASGEYRQVENDYYEQTSVVELVNEPTKLTIEKKDTEGNRLSGAELRILKDGSQVYAWTTNGKKKSINGVLDVNTVYTLKEVKAPEGYALAEDISFAINEDGVLYINPEKDDNGVCKVPIKGTKAEDNTICMVDAKIIKMPLTGSHSAIWSVVIGMLLLLSGYRLVRGRKEKRMKKKCMLFILLFMMMGVWGIRVSALAAPDQKVTTEKAVIFETDVSEKVASTHSFFAVKVQDMYEIQEAFGEQAAVYHYQCAFSTELADAFQAKLDENGFAYNAANGEITMKADGSRVISKAGVNENESDAAKLASVIADFVIKNHITGKSVNMNVLGAEPQSSTTLACGYWVLYETIADDVTDKTVATKPVLFLVEPESTSLSVGLKDSSVSLHKYIHESDSETTAEIGTVIPFTLTATLPVYEADAGTLFGENLPRFELNDTLSEGLALKLNSDDTVKLIAKMVKTGETDITLGTSDYTAEYDNTTNSFTIALKKHTILQYQGFDIVVTYSAELTADAVINKKGGNDNKVTLTYSNNPHVASSVGTLEDRVFVYTFGLDLRKLDATDGTLLGGAVFQVKKGASVLKFKKNEEMIEEVKRIVYTVDSNGSEDISTISGGDIIIKGLDAAAYTFVEMVSPGGYAMPDSEVIVTIEKAQEASKTTGAAKITVENATVLKDGETQEKDTYISGADGKSDVNVLIRNYKMLQLPLTGRRTSIILIVAGAVLIAGGGVWIIIRRKKTGMKER